MFTYAGNIHIHSSYSDGSGSIEEIAKAAAKAGLDYIVITDHSQYLKVANGLTPERLLQQKEEIARVNELFDDFTIFSGVEMDILPDGTLDYDDELLAEMDFVIASIHSAFSQPKKKIMERLITALKNPHVDMIAHPTGRKIGIRDGYEVDMDMLIEIAKETNTCLELNANPNRLDLHSQNIRKAQEAGVTIAINTDAHHIAELQNMEIGVSTAKKGWIKRSSVLNAMSLEEFKVFLRR